MKVAITSPLLAGTRSSTSSGTLRGCGLGAREICWLQHRMEGFGIGLVDAPDDVDLLQRGPRRMRDFAGNERREYLPADAALAQPGNVGVAVIMDLGQVVAGDVALRTGAV